MKKKRGILIGSALGFLAVLLGEVYCLLNFRGDVVMAAGIGLVLLIMAYLMLDAGFDYWESLQETEEQAFFEEGQAGQEGLNRVEAELKLLRKDLSDLLKAEIQYERENTRALISHNKKEMEQLSEELQKFRKMTEETLKQIERK